jgi:hypothetical protein
MKKLIAGSRAAVKEEREEREERETERREKREPGESHSRAGLF